MHAPPRQLLLALHHDFVRLALRRFSSCDWLNIAADFLAVQAKQFIVRQSSELRHAEVVVVGAAASAWPMKQFVVEAD
jgi:hypothetical protein